MTRGPLPPRQAFRLCRTRECEVVYFGAADAILHTTALSQAPWFKEGGEVVCFCFGYGKEDLANQAEERIIERVRAGDCACELRNPSGKCCLGELRLLRRPAAGGTT